MKNIIDMYEKKIPLDLECGIKITMEVIGGKWKSCILEALDKRPNTHQYN